MKPWELSTKVNSEDYLIREWAKLKPSDFYFAAHNGDDYATIICITPKLYFQEYKHMYKSSMPISHLLPRGLFEKLPSVFMIEEPMISTMKKLYATGFVHSKDLQDFTDEAAWVDLTDTN